MVRIIRSISSVVVLTAIFSYGQIISFNAPNAWLTMRNDTIIAKAQLDTAQLKQKSVTLSLVQVLNGVKKTIVKKDFKVTDYSMDFSFGKIKRDIIGGTDYLKLEWSVPKSEEKGTIAPIGIVDLSKVEKGDQLKASRVQDGVSADAVSGGITNEQFQKVGSIEYATAWNKDALFFVVKKAKDSSSVRFSIDGKNGKNAFLSYPDRMVAYDASTDSVYGVHYTRALDSDTLKYNQQAWNTDITKVVVGDRIVIKMPWYDTGIIPFDSRMIGFGVFALASNGKITNSIPAKAQMYIPGTYTDLVLLK